MKLNQSILTAVLGLGLAGVCSAGNVYLSGSTAMRSSVYTTLSTPGAVFVGTPTVVGTSSDTYTAFQGTLVGGAGTTTIFTSWSGSEAGISNVVNYATSTQEYLNSSLNPADPHQSAASHLAMADNDQNYSRTKSPAVGAKAAVAAITFKWIRNKGLWTGTNVTDAMIRAAFGGYCKRAVFTGNSADVNDYVYVSGRNSLSGTRVNAFGTCGYGIFTIPNQIEIDNSGNMLDLDGFGTYAGDFGYESGGTLCKTMQGDTTTKSDLWNGGTGFSVICYGGTGDADAGIALGATELTYNGVKMTPANVIEGTYTFWGNEYIMKAANVPAASEADQVYNLLKNNIPATCDGYKAIALTAMHCTRTGPTTDPAHN